MRKRFLDADIFSKQWFRKLSAQQKVLWLYIISNCSHDGFWEYDPERLTFECNGYEGDIPDIIKEKLQMIPIDDSQYLLKSFIRFQYGKLKMTAPVHKRIIERIFDKGLHDHFEELEENF
tara:strand:- start:147 stop:506 length:360 start_codon:yes stop_codon:yes gene_type:complete